MESPNITSERHNLMRYVLLIYSSEVEFEKLAEAERVALMQGHMAFVNQYQSQIVGGDPLQPTSTATTVCVRNGKIMTTDGPFAETKEQLAGIYVLNCKDLDEAITLASKIPDAAIGAVEIRPALQIG